MLDFCFAHHCKGKRKLHRLDGNPRRPARSAQAVAAAAFLATSSPIGEALAFRADGRGWRVRGRLSELDAVLPAEIELGQVAVKVASSQW